MRTYLNDDEYYKNKLLDILCKIGKDRKYWENILAELLKDNELAYFLHTYIDCFTEHKEDDNDGNLNMFRGYGRNKGAAMIFADFFEFRCADCFK